MAVISNSRTFQLPHTLRFFGTLYSAVTTWKDARATRKALSSLSARELDDLGLTRADIDAVARGTYR